MSKGERMKTKEEIVLLISQIREGNNNAFSELLEEYKPLMSKMALEFSNKTYSADTQDLKDEFLQEARLALYNAALRYDLKRDDITFGAFAKTCVRNRIISAMRKYITAEKRKAKALEESKNRQSLVQKDNDLFELASQYDLSDLSDFEKYVLSELANGKKVRVIANETDHSTKSVSNAAFRAREKMKSLLKDKMPK